MGTHSGPQSEWWSAPLQQPRAFTELQLYAEPAERGAPGGQLCRASEDLSCQVPPLGTPGLSCSPVPSSCPCCLVPPRAPAAGLGGGGRAWRK